MKVYYPDFSQQQLIAVLKDRLTFLSDQLPVRRAVLFGSWATGTASAFSDVDLLVIYADPPRPDAYMLVRRCLGIRGLEPHVYSECEAEESEESIRRMTRGGTVLKEVGREKREARNGSREE